LTGDSGIAFAAGGPAAETLPHQVTLFYFVFEEKFMTARRLLTSLAAILITLGQTLIFAADTAASAEAMLASVANLAQSSAGSSHA
jgi:hypothetical protein